MPRIYRIRYIPSEIVDLSSDTLLFRDQQYLITEWKPIKPRNDISWGLSCVFLENGWKISAFFDDDKKFKYWYCDIVDIEYRQETDIYNLYDLLVDVKVMNDGKVEVIDLEELAFAFETDLITPKQLSMSLRKTSELLNFIYSSNLSATVRDIIFNCTGKEIKV